MEYHHAAPDRYMPDNIDYDAALRIEWRNKDDATWRIAKEHVVGYLFDCFGVANEVVPGCAELDGVPIVGYFEVQAIHEQTGKRWVIYKFFKETQYSKPMHLDDAWNPSN